MTSRTIGAWIPERCGIDPSFAWITRLTSTDGNAPGRPSTRVRDCLCGSLIRGHVPDVGSIFPDRSVGGEPADIRSVQDGRLPPLLRAPPDIGDVPLGSEIVVEIGADQEVVVIA